MHGFFRRLTSVRGTSETVRPSFRDVRFGLLVAGEAVNSIGGWASAIVLWGFAAYRFDAGSYAVSLTIVCWAAPPAVLSPLCGVWVDRIGPRKALVAGYVAAAVAALGMAGAGSLTVLDVAAAGYGVARAVAGPAANALPPRIVVGDDLLAANALLGGAASAGSVLGPLAASAALALSGFPAAFLVVEPLYARHVLHRPPSQFALFEAAAGVGGILASLLIPRLRDRLSGRWALGASGACYGLAACMFTGTTVVPVAYAGAFLWGVTGTVFGAVAITALQRAAPAGTHGRIMGVTSAIGSWVETIGLPLAGVTLAGLGLRAGVFALAGVAILAGLACLAVAPGASGATPIAEP